MANAWVYPALAVTGIILSSLVWNRLLRDRPQARDPRLLYIYLAALAGALFGAKCAYLFSEGWMHLVTYGDNPALAWRQWLTGKSITGALLGGYGAVELVKWMTGYRHATGDLFALIAPGGLVLGRVGCLVSGCCLGMACEPSWYTLTDVSGVARWPAVPVELTFNLLMALFAFVCWRKRLFQGQLFHLYIIFYGVFRFAHEFLRNTPAMLGPLSGYHFVALSLIVLGFLRYRHRARYPIS